jgi:hypothetical protein
MVLRLQASILPLNNFLKTGKMKQLITLLAAAIICTTATAQTDSTKTKTPDTIRIGGMVIVKDGKRTTNKNWDINIGKINEHRRNANVATNWVIVDLGFNNYTDNTNYANTGTYLINKPGATAINENDFKLRTGKSINVNFWLFMQRVNLIKHHVNLKYGLGVEFNNYRYKSTISYKEDGYVPYTTNTQTNAPFVFRDSISFSKNKLGLNYLTVPVMLNFTTNKSNSKKNISVSAGVSAGYLYGQRNKQVSSERGKDKNRGDYGLNQFKFSYVAELRLGPLNLYGSYSPKSMYENYLDIKPYTVGIRFSNW